MRRLWKGYCAMCAATLGTRGTHARWRSSGTASSTPTALWCTLWLHCSNLAVPPSRAAPAGTFQTTRPGLRQALRVFCDQIDALQVQMQLNDVLRSAITASAIIELAALQAAASFAKN